MGDDLKEIVEKMFASRGELKDYVYNNCRRGDIQHIIDTIDEYGWKKQWLMNIGDQKGKILDQAIQTRKPKSVLELGTFLGYSALRIVTLLPEDAIFITIESDAESANIARAIHEFAGVNHRIKIVDGDTDEVIPQLTETFNVKSFDLIFIDHYKGVYLRDFKMLEELDLIKSGTMIVADNVITPGVPDYLEYVRNNPNYTTKFYDAKLEYRDDLPDGIEVSIRK